MTRLPLARDLLRPQQHEIAGLIRRHRALLIDLKMAGGKTISALTAARHLLDTFEVRRVLVIAPLRVARDTWPAEIEAWEHTRCISYAAAVGKDAERRAAVAADAEITVTNFECLAWLVALHGRRWPYDCVIIDESSRFKAGKKRTSTTKRKGADGKVRVTKGGNLTRFGSLAAVRRYIQRIVLLTGTPMPGGVRDLWGQMYLIDQGERLGATMTAFEDRWFDKNRYSYEVKPKPGAETEILARIKDVFFSFPPPDDIPVPIMIDRPVQLPRDVLQEYQRFKRNMVSELHDVEAVSQGVLTNKLLQFANGSMYREDRSIAHVHDAKINELDALLDEANGDPMLVLYGFKFDLAQIRKRHPDAVVLAESRTAVADWNAGKIGVLLAHPANCAHGLNLQFGGHLGCWYGLTWSLELYLQTNARLPRPGQKWPVAMYRIIAEGTDDRRMLRVLDDRNATQDDFTRVIRESIRDA